MGLRQTGSRSGVNEPEIGFWILAMPLLASLFLLGMPHGAIDHLFYFKGRGRKLRWKAVSIFCALYLLVAIVMTGFWLLFPVLSCLGLLLLTWFHWGDGDRIYERLGGGNAGGWFQALRGGIPMVLPLVLYPGQVSEVLDGALSVTGDVLPDSIGGLLQHPATRWASLGLMAALWGLEEIRESRIRETGRIRAETAGLFVWFLLVPPLWSIGFYFMFWHARRHIICMARQTGPPLQTGNRVHWSTFTLWAAPFTAVGVLMVTGFALWTGPLETSASPMRWVGSYLLVLWALTWPHAVTTRIVFEP